MRLSENDNARIAGAVAEAERKTSGEVLCVIADKVSDYREVALAWAAVVALAAPPIALWLGLRPLELAARFGQWTAGHAAADDAQAALVLFAYALVQVVLFVLVGLLASIPAVKRLLTPSWLKARRVRRAALGHFAATGLDGSPERTGVVIFAALFEHRVEIVADTLINERCGANPWNAAVSALVAGVKSGEPASGFVRAVEICGEVLSRHFPDDGGPNRAPDRPVQV